MFTRIFSEQLAKAFHPLVTLYSVDRGKLDETPMADWLKNLVDRKAKGDIRVANFKLEQLDVTEAMAFAKITLEFPKLRFTDYLSLLEIEGKWTIIGKIYSVENLFKER